MADNCLMSSLDSWAFRSFGADSFWPSSDSDAFTRALLLPLISPSVDSTTSDIGSPSETNPVFPKPEPEPVPAPKQRNLPCSPSARISKRKSRASKKTPTTYITADAANFRQMVQQVTGVRFVGGDAHVPVEAVVRRPEPVRGGGVVGMGLCLPTLDTSAVLLDRARMAAEVGPAEVNGSGFDQYDGFPIFPTLESWTPM